MNTLFSLKLWFRVLLIQVFLAAVFSSSAFAQVPQEWCQKYGARFAPASIPGPWVCGPYLATPWRYAPSSSSANGLLYSTPEEAMFEMKRFLEGVFSPARGCTVSFGSFSPWVLYNNDWATSSTGTVTISGCKDFSVPESTQVYITGTRQLSCSTESIYVSSDPNGHPFCLSSSPPPPKVIVLDPGHGLTCALIKQQTGAIGVTDFPANDPPPGKLQEDYLTVAIATQLKSYLSASGYDVSMTKSDVSSCPSFLERGKIANSKNAKIFVSVHIDAPQEKLGPLLPFVMGTTAFYHSEKPLSKVLADEITGPVSAALGLNNRGTAAREFAVLKPTTTNMPAVLVEVARLSGQDEKILHTKGSIEKAAAGIKAGIDAYFKK